MGNTLIKKQISENKSEMGSYNNSNHNEYSHEYSRMKYNEDFVSAHAKRNPVIHDSSTMEEGGFKEKEVSQNFDNEGQSMKSTKTDIYDFSEELKLLSNASPYV